MCFRSGCLLAEERDVASRTVAFGENMGREEAENPAQGQVERHTIEGREMSCEERVTLKKLAHVYAWENRYRKAKAVLPIWPFVLGDCGWENELQLLRGNVAVHIVPFLLSFFVTICVSSRSIA